MINCIDGTFIDLDMTSVANEEEKIFDYGLYLHDTKSFPVSRLHIEPPESDCTQYLKHDEIMPKIREKCHGQPSCEFVLDQRFITEDVTEECSNFDSQVFL